MMAVDCKMCIRDRFYIQTHRHFSKNHFSSCFEGSTIRISPYLEHDSFRYHHTSISLRNMDIKIINRDVSHYTQILILLCDLTHRHVSERTKFVLCRSIKRSSMGLRSRHYNLLPILNSVTSLLFISLINSFKSASVTNWRQSSISPKDFRSHALVVCNWQTLDCVN